MECPICNKELKFLNTPVFGVGKLHNGISLCNKCYNEIIFLDHKIKINTLSVEDVKKLIGNKIEIENNLNNKLKEINGSEIINNKIIKEFSNKINVNENIISFIEGIVVSKLTPCSILVTNEKILYGIDDVMNVGISEINIKNITSINTNKNLLTLDIFIETINTKFPISVNLKKGPEFLEKLNTQIDKIKGDNQINNEDSILLIENLFKLKEKGILTEEEFQKKKKQILGI
jgi:hypothetical protein